MYVRNFACIIKQNKCVYQEGIGGSYRLASLDRLANRQRLLEQNNGLGQLDNKNGTTENGGNITSGVRINSILLIAIFNCV